MVELRRTVRFCINDASQGDDPGGRDNTFSAWPAMRGLGRYYELEVACRGEPDAKTGYVMNIKRIDEAARAAALPLIEQAARSGGAVTLGDLMRRMLRALESKLDHSVTRLRLALTPYFSLSIRSRSMDQIEISQQYEFSAAHRLHVPQLSDQENLRIFGKCNNPAGHGHNYRVQVAVNVAMDDRGSVLPVERLDQLVNARVIEKLDHKHLNHDVPQFAALNPSVEHIAKVIWDMLAAPLGDLGAELQEVSVWETGKTVCTYRGPRDRAEP
ncbi:MAG: 6-carboxytetrahydropterin synthase [Phycisphaeraceae bacterium]|nr:6-carboxytetrahydropterin synthase [Phycisphaeraceae bacterium]